MEMNYASGLVFVFSMLFLIFSLFTLIEIVNDKSMVKQKKRDVKNEGNKLSNENYNLLNALVNFDLKSAIDRVSIISYNILSQKFAKLNKRLCQENINFDNRLRTILKEITELESDIICLQEVNLEVLNQFFLRPLILYGYYVLYGRNEGSNFLNLTAFKTSKFKLISSKNFKISLENHSSLFIGNRGVFKVELIHNLSGKCFVIYNVHFPWRPHLEYIKCVVLSIILEDISNLYNNLHNILICGDFNSLPNSLVLKLMYFDIEREFFENTKKLYKINKISEDNLIPQKLYYQILRQPNESTNFEKIQSNLYKLTKKLWFRSAYENYQIFKKNLEVNENDINYTDNHPQFTNFTRKFCGNIDYIFYSQNLNLSKILKLVTREELENQTSLPSLKYPSDHLKIYAEFLIK